MKHLVIAALFVAQLMMCADMPIECFVHPSNLLACERVEINGVRYGFTVYWPIVNLRRD